MTNEPKRTGAWFKAFLVLVGTVLLAAAVPMWFLQHQPRIAARTQLYVAPMPPAILFAERSPLDSEAFLRSQAYLIKDHFVLNAALRDNPELAELSLLKEHADPLQWLEKEITVSFPSPEIMHISLSGDRPEEQKKIVSAVTRAYLDRFANKERAEFLARQQALKMVVNRSEARTRRKRHELRTLQQETAPIKEEGMAIFQKIALDDLKAARMALTKVHGELRTLQVELAIRPDWLEQTWPRYAALLNGLPGPGLPINHAVVALLHDEVLLGTHPDKQTREKVKEKYRVLKETEKILLAEVTRLDEETKVIRKQVFDLTELTSEIEQDEKLMKLANERLQRMEVEQDAPQRITWPDREAVLYDVPRETGWVAAAAAALAGVGIFLLLLAAFRFRTRKANVILEQDSSTPSLPE